MILAYLIGCLVAALPLGYFLYDDYKKGWEIQIGHLLTFSSMVIASWFAVIVLIVLALTECKWTKKCVFKKKS